MSTEIGKLNDKQLTRFFGGVERGPCIQITSADGYIQLSASEIIALLPELKKIIDYNLEGKKAECERVMSEYREMEKTIVKDMYEVAKMAIAQPVFDMAALLNLGQDKIDRSESDE